MRLFGITPSPQVVQILCPECGGIQNTVTKHEDEKQYIICTKCESRWWIKFPEANLNIPIREAMNTEDSHTTEPLPSIKPTIEPLPSVIKPRDKIRGPGRGGGSRFGR